MIPLVSPERLSICSKIGYRFLLIILCLCAPVLIRTTSAQNIQSRPVARLITGSNDTTSYSRPRRAGVSTATPTHAKLTAPSESPSLREATKNERRAFEVTNEVRTRNGLAPFVWDADLCRMARVHSENMARLGFFSHETPAGLHMKDRARAVGIRRFRVLGENIAYNQGFDDPGAFVVERWMTSSGHRANILSREFRSAGIGSFVAADGRIYFTQVFILR